MTLGENIAALRGAHKLSQGDLAERLDVSRQSVSKWETGQAVPELDKIIKLADLFEVTVDELVREGETPRPDAAPAGEPQIIYVEQPVERADFSPVQKAGIVTLVAGAVMLFCIMYNVYVPLIGMPLIILSLPLIFARKHPFLIDGWLIALASWPLGVRMGLTPTGLLRGLEWIYHFFTMQLAAGRRAVLLGGVLAVARSILTWALAIYTARLCWKKWKGRSGRKEETAP